MAFVDTFFLEQSFKGSGFDLQFKFHFEDQGTGNA